MSYANIGGMFFPFTMESNINVDNPFFMVPWTCLLYTSRCV